MNSEGSEIQAGNEAVDVSLDGRRIKLAKAGRETKSSDSVWVDIGSTFYKSLQRDETPTRCLNSVSNSVNSLGPRSSEK